MTRQSAPYRIGVDTATTVSALGEVGQGIEPLITICRYMITNRVRLGEPERWGCSWTERGTRCLTPGPEGPAWLCDSPSPPGSPGGRVRSGSQLSGLVKGQFVHALRSSWPADAGRRRLGGQQLAGS